MVMEWKYAPRSQIMTHITFFEEENCAHLKNCNQKQFFLFENVSTYTFSDISSGKRPPHGSENYENFSKTNGN